jgi:NAD(P)-dependent dehydrogenase (short-subunit alcohol dehydrogenase family)
VDVTPEEWDQVFSVNARGTFFCLQAVARGMVAAGGGRIVNLTSTAGKASAKARGFSYGSAKGAVEVMTRLAANQLAPHNVAVNAVCPGSTRAGAYLRRMGELAADRNVGLDEAIKIGDQAIPIGRSNEPADVAAVVAFLASDEARNITGQSWNVDGGLLWGH